MEWPSSMHRSADRPLRRQVTHQCAWLWDRDLDLERDIASSICSSNSLPLSLNDSTTIRLSAIHQSTWPTHQRLLDWFEIEVRLSLVDAFLLSLCLSLLVGIDSIIEPLDVVLSRLLLVVWLFDDDLAVCSCDRSIGRRLTRVIVIVIDRWIGVPHQHQQHHHQSSCGLHRIITWCEAPSISRSIAACWSCSWFERLAMKRRWCGFRTRWCSRSVELSFGCTISRAPSSMILFDLIGDWR